MLRVLLVLVLIALAIASAWLVPAFGLPAWIPAALTALALGVALVLVIVALGGRWLGRRRAARRGQDPTLRTLRAFVGQELARLAEDGARGLAWTIVIGPPGAGKSALIRRSGLAFRPGYGPERFVVAGDLEATDRAAFYLGEVVADANNNADPNNNANPNNNADPNNNQSASPDPNASAQVIVDTTGRHLRGGTASDLAEWGVLLGALAQAGPTTPLAAIVVVVAAPELLAAADLEPIAAPIRARIDEIQARLGVVAPIHVVVSKLDRIAGAEPLLRRVRGGRGSVGVGVEVSGPGADAARKLAEQHLAGLTADLERAAFVDLGEAADPAARAERLRAADALVTLGRRSTELIAALFADHGQAGAPILRGILWASAGAPTPTWPIDPVLEDMRRELGDVPLRTSRAATQAAPFLIDELFTAMIPASRWIAGPSRARIRRRRIGEALRAGALGLASASLLVALIGAAQANHHLLGEALGASQALARDPGGARPIAHADIAPLQSIAHTLRAYQEDGAPWSIRWGLYQGEALAGPVDALYRQAASERLLAPLAAAAHGELERMIRRSRAAAGELPAEEFWRATEVLRLYLALTQGPKGEDDSLSSDDRRWLPDALARAWGEGESTAEEGRSLRAQFSERLVERDWARLADARSPRDGAVVEHARVILRRTARGALWADEVAARPLSAPAISLATIAPAATTWLQNNDRRVRAAFTRQGWLQIHSLLTCDEPGADADAGEFGRYLAAARVIDARPCEAELRSLHAEYFGRYVREWNHFLDTVHVVEPEGYEAIRGRIEEMTITGGPEVNALEGLFRAVADNARLPADPGGAAARERAWLPALIAEIRGKAGLAESGATVTTVESALGPFYSYGFASASSPLQAYFSVLMRIQGPLGEYTRSREAANLEQARTHAADVFRLIYEEQLPLQHPQWKPVLERILEPPIRGLLEEVRRGERDLLTQRWCNEVVGPFDAMRICYPFNRDGTCSASASEVAELFHPDKGALWRLYEDQLQGRFPFQGDRYTVAAQGYGSRLRLNPQVAELLTHAKELGEVLFPGKSAEPRFDFSIQFQPSTQSSKITFVVDETSVEYNNNHNDAFRPISWPGGGGNGGAKIIADTHLGEQLVHRQGYWGLFRLIEEGDVSQDRRFILVKMRVGVAKDVRFLLNPESGSGNPLFGRLRPDARIMDVFRPPRLQVPRNLFVGGMSCKAPPSASASQSPSPPAP